MHHLTDRQVIMCALDRWKNELQTGNAYVDIAEARMMDKDLPKMTEKAEEFVNRLKEMKRELLLV